jgi:two-component system cell cycle sensor histidine kinase/response regulator CckA
LDLVMPRMDGGQTYMELKKFDKKVKAVFCSGYTSEKVITGLLTEENLKAIQKPFHPADFIRIVQEVIAQE